MGLKTATKDYWRSTVASCCGHSDETDQDASEPDPGETETPPFHLSFYTLKPHSYSRQRCQAYHVSPRDPTRMILRTQLLATFYLLLLIHLLIKPGLCFTPYRKERFWFNHGERPKIHSDTMFEEPEHQPPERYKPYTDSRVEPSRPGPVVGAMEEPPVAANRYSNDVDKMGDTWIVPGAGAFQHRAMFNFTSGVLPRGLEMSHYTVQDTERNDVESPHIPYNHIFEPVNVKIVNGILHLRVPGQQRDQPKDNNALSCAQITTSERKILHASVRTRAMFSREPGTCHGIFFYRNDQQETDIEYLTDPRSLSNNGVDEPVPMWYSNQRVNPEEGPTTQGTGPAPFDATSKFHEYRIDWTADFTAFYIDGVEQKRFTDNIPSIPGPWVWNNWANGDRGWSYGPPENDNEFKIKSIVMYYNTQADE
ncbi:hypothetical protein LTR84_004974 [Exophiala bonariae]|uniref:GH16 domain-containing protein n=1 Tax=Exophiala bonariae TaxID=1690606 RepID=A0AAV9NNG0_9EURO|nr:hypothetical protein LTR84_004974 [Exophiala bonariae]